MMPASVLSVDGKARTAIDHARLCPEVVNDLYCYSIFILMFISSNLAINPDPNEVSMWFMKGVVEYEKFGPLADLRCVRRNRAPKPRLLAH